MGPAISTSWNAHRSSDAARLLFEIKSLGFSCVELSYNLSAAFVKDVSVQAPKLGISIGSLHNYCPAPPGIEPFKALPDCFSLASLDEDERCLAVKNTKNTIDTAADLGASAVVLHCGRVQMPDVTRQLIQLYEAGQAKTMQFEKLRQETQELRRSDSTVYLEQVLKSLEQLDRHAASRNIRLGIENRFYYCEIPNFNEIRIVLENFPGSRVYYWHDTGHAQVMENLGFARHQDYLESYSSRLLGVHLHDIRGCLDHLAPGSGDFDFKKLKPYLGENVLKVIEAHYPATGSELIKARELVSANL